MKQERTLVQERPLGLETAKRPCGAGTHFSVRDYSPRSEAEWDWRLEIGG